MGTSAGVAPELTQAGAVQFHDEDGSVVAEMPAPTITDAAESGAPAGAVKYSLEAGEGGWELAVEADPGWLQAPDRAWPVTIDPTTVVPSPTLDCTIGGRAGSNTSQKCDANPARKLVTAYWPKLTSSSDEWERVLFRFGLGAIPAPSEITSATFNVHASEAALNTSGLELRRVTRPWTEQVNWTHYDDKHLWTNEGGDYTDEVGKVLTSERGSAPGWWSFPLSRQPVQEAVSNPESLSFLMKLIDDKSRECGATSCTQRQIKFDSRAATEKPYLSVNYYGPAFPDRKVTSPTDGTKTAKRFLLTAGWEQSGVAGISFQYKSGKLWVNIPEGHVTDESGQAVKWPIHANTEELQSKPVYWDASSLTGTKQTAKVQIRAMILNISGESGYTKPVEAEVNRDLGGPKDATTEVGPGSVDLLTGNFTVSRTDVSMPAFNSNLEFTRSFSSREANSDPTGPLGPGWKLGTPMEAAGSTWSGLKLETFKETLEEEGEQETFEYKWAALKDVEGGEIDFEETSPGHWATPPEVSGYVLQEVAGSAGTEIALSEPEGNRTIFSNGGAGAEYRLKSVSMTGGGANKSRYVYDVGPSGKLRLSTYFAPAAPGIDCSGEFALGVSGCRALVFFYTTLEASQGGGERLYGVNFRADGNGEEFTWPVARFEYDAQGRLSGEYDMRIFPRLKETYTYEATGQLKAITPPGQEPWTMVYGSVSGETPNGRLVAVKRPSLVATNPTAQTTISYGAPLSGAAAPYKMGGAEVAQWGQTDVPTDATAIFPANEIPASPPSSYARATVYYMDAEGQLSNVASPSGAGTSAPSISTTEFDKFGNVVRELTAQNRLRALQASEPAARSHQIDTRYRYSADGTELQNERGPLHSVKLKSGASAEARAYRSAQYTTGGEPPYHLPLQETTGALLNEGTPQEEVADPRTTRYEYDLTLRKPTKAIVDPGSVPAHLNIITETAYDKETGLPLETRQPKAAGSAEATAGMTRILYYTAEKPPVEECEKSAWAGLPCKIYPAAQPGTAGLPQLPVRRILAYNAFAEPTEISESPGGGTEDVRLTRTIYDNLGRKVTTKIEGGGQVVPKVKTEYDATLGLPIVQKFVCEPECADNQAVTTGYDKLGRAVSYKDADGNEATTKFDLLGRPESTTDAKGSQKYRYDSITGLLTELEDSGAGTFTATYNADGSIATRGLPNGITATTEYDEVGTPVHLAYTKQTSCGESCTWLDFEVEDSIDGQTLSEASSLVDHAYSYDAAGRLTQAQETPTGGACTTRTYGYDKDSNRLSRGTTTAVLGGACPAEGSSSKTSYTYDTADRLTGGPTYDPFGRITSLPKAMAGGTTALTTTYFSTDMVATQAQSGITNTFELDAALRQRQRLQGGGGLEGTEVFHYDGSADSPVWTERAGLVTRNIVGIGGDLAAVHEVGKPVVFQLTNLHGDVVATAGSSAETKLKATFRFDEFGVPLSGTAGRFGWLGGKRRRTELPSGVIQMGVRSYVPAIGRFLSPDPIFGGSANSYDYANQDPINAFDISGQCMGPESKRGCGGQNRRRWKTEKRQAVRAFRRDVQRLRQLVSKVRDQHSGNRALLTGFQPSFGWFQDELEGAQQKADGIIQSITHAGCGKSGAVATSGGTVLAGIGEVLTANGFKAAGTIVTGVGKGAAYAGSALLLGHEAGYC